MKPVQIEMGEWLFMGCFIQKQNHPKLRPYHIFKDTLLQETVGCCFTFTEAKKIASENEVINPLHKPSDFL